MTDLAEYLTPAQAAAVLNVHKWTLYRELRAGRIVGIRVGRAWRIHKSHLEPTKPGEVAA